MLDNPTGRPARQEIDRESPPPGRRTSYLLNIAAVLLGVSITGPWVVERLDTKRYADAFDADQVMTGGEIAAWVVAALVVRLALHVLMRRITKERTHKRVRAGVLLLACAASWLMVIPRLMVSAADRPSREWSEPDQIQPETLEQGATGWALWAYRLALWSPASRAVAGCRLSRLELRAGMAAFRHGDVAVARRFLSRAAGRPCTEPRDIWPDVWMTKYPQAAKNALAEMSWSGRLDLEGIQTLSRSLWLRFDTWIAVTPLGLRLVSGWPDECAVRAGGCDLTREHLQEARQRQLKHSESLPLEVRKRHGWNSSTADAVVDMRMTVGEVRRALEGEALEGWTIRLWAKVPWLPGTARMTFSRPEKPKPRAAWAFGEFEEAPSFEEVRRIVLAGAKPDDSFSQLIQDTGVVLRIPDERPWSEVAELALRWPGRGLVLMWLDLRWGSPE